MKQLVMFATICLATVWAVAGEQTPAGELETEARTADHSQFEVLRQAFSKGEEVTQACRSCHNLADAQFKKSIHWTWQSDGNHDFGKGSQSMNNFCISTNKMNDPACMNCHPAWNAKGVQGEVNCLKCHSAKLMNWSEAFDDIEGLEVDPEDVDAMSFAKEIRDELIQSIVSIGPTQRENCGACHFKGGGGEAVKHGDLDSSLLHADRRLDVHMAKNGGDFTCSRCHTTHDHQISGRRYDMPAVAKAKTLVEDDHAARISCVSCHTDSPHREMRLNNHTRTVSCQACHIPEVAKEEPTMVEWDWSKAGKLKDGFPYVEESEYGGHFYSYKSIKGEFKWKKNLIPEYSWYNGSMSQMTFEDEINPRKTVSVNFPKGSAEDGSSKIYPFKKMRTIQPFDRENNRLVAPLLSTSKGFWKTLDWDSAIREGMLLQGIEYSGKMAFVKTEFYHPLNHMIAPGEMALSCQDCHKADGRMAGIKGVYVPGRDGNPWVDGFGLFIVCMTFLGVLIHALLRYSGQQKQRKTLQEEVANG